MATRGKMTDLEKQKRADRREAKQNAPCPHDWADVVIDGSPFAQCRICQLVAVGVVMR